jgi:hypothetical protein
MNREPRMMSARTLAELRGVTVLLCGSIVAGCARGSELESGSGGGASSDPTQRETTTGASGGNTAPASASSAGTGMGGEGAGGAEVAGVGSSQVATTSASVAASTGSGAPCEGSGDCQTCQACSIEAACAADYAACLANLQCGFYGTCRAGCTTDTCVQGCQAIYPLGVSAHEALAACVCGGCPNDCAGSAWGC